MANIVCVSEAMIKLFNASMYGVSEGELLSLQSCKTLLNMKILQALRDYYV